MRNLLNWIFENKNWVFSGVGLTILGFLANYFRKGRESVVMKQKSGKNSINIQNTGTLNMKEDHVKKRGKFSDE